MRSRHNPSLHTHPEGFQSPPSASTSISQRNNSYSNDYSGTSSQTSKPYIQFQQRYRSSNLTQSDDPRNDPDSYYSQRGLDPLLDAGDNGDEDELDRQTLTDRLDNEVMQPTSQKERERLEWQNFLSSVLGGHVLKSEKTRIASALLSISEQHSTIHTNFWLGIRARFHGRTDEEERKRLEERRIRVVDAVVDEINRFRVTLEDQDEDPIASALKQVSTVLHHFDVAQSLYPTLKAMYIDKPATAEAAFQARFDTLNTWSTILSSVRQQINLLRRWTGSSTLDVTEPNTGDKSPISNRSTHELTAATSFVERLLKEESMQRTFEKGFLVTVHAFIGVARDAQVNRAVLFREMNLPSFETELVPLISFPTKLSQAALRVRLAHIQKLTEPDVMTIDQMTEDLKIGIGLACTLKRQYEAFLVPDPGGNWTLDQCISEDYDATILEALSIFFRLIHWKLKSGAKGINFKETDVLEAQWATFNDVSLTTAGGSCLVAEQLCSLTNKLMVRVTNDFDTQVRVPTGEDMNRDLRVGGQKGLQTKMSNQQIIDWYRKILDNVRLRYRELQRFARVLTQRFSNSAEYDLENVPLDQFVTALVATDHFLVYTNSLEEQGVYVVASDSLYERPDSIRRLLTEAFHVDEISNDDVDRLVGNTELEAEEYDEAQYLLVMSPCNPFIWNGRVLLLSMPSIDLDAKDNRVRLIADGPQRRLSLAKQAFTNVFSALDEDEELLETTLGPLTCLTESQAHLPTVNKELGKIRRARLAQSIVDSVHHVRNSLRLTSGFQERLESGCQELLGNWYMFASEHGQHAQRYMDRNVLAKFNRLLVKLAISWVSFISDNCEPTDSRTFKWAVNALEFTFYRTKRNILQLPDEQFKTLKDKVGSCASFLQEHFDVLGARSTLEASKEKKKPRPQVTSALLDDEDGLSKLSTIEQDDSMAFLDTTTRMFWEKVTKSLQLIEERRAESGKGHGVVGRALDDGRPEDRSLVFLASSSSNIAIRWQQGKFIGSGAFGSVYSAVNLDSGSVMAVKEIKFQELSGLPSLYAQIKDELGVMEMLHHPNVVEYYGMEVHRDKVYIFEEYCQRGSLAALLNHGRIEDENIIQLYTMQMLEGLAYLHKEGVIHRDIKPDNILLDHLGDVKLADFGAAKILAKNHKTMQRSRRISDVSPPPPISNGLAMNSLTGTPMYMSPEIIKNDKTGRKGAMDIWSLGCVVLECATGKKPWSNLDNEWAIMFRIGVATQHPPLPEPHQLSTLGIAFIEQCLTIDPIQRPTAVELLQHQWMVDFRAFLKDLEEAERRANSHLTQMPEESFENTTVQATIIQEKEVEETRRASPVTPRPLTPNSDDGEDS